MSTGAGAEIARPNNDSGRSITSAAPLFTISSLGRQLKGSTLLPLLIAGAAAIALIAALLLWANGPVYRVLFSNLGEADGGRIINELDARGVPYQFDDSGQAIMVPGDLVHALRLQLAEQGLPQGGNVGFELLDSQAFGISQFTEQVNYQRGLEGELARSIESLSPVASARVHLSMAKASVFIREREPAKASVVLTLQGGRTLGNDQVNAIMYLVSSSVPDLAVEQVTVVDHAGNLLSQTDTADDLDTTHLAYIEEVERRYQERIETMLVPMFGEQNIQVQVAAQIDFSVREETSERYAPNQTPEAAAVRSTQLNSSYNGGDELAAGIPGALSNTPPGWAPSFIEQPAADPALEAQAGTAAQPAALNTLQYDNIINYEVDRNITHTQHQRGQIQRLSVAALVNYRDTVDENGNPVQQALEPAEMEQVLRLVRQAMGFSAARGDEVEVVNSPFSTQYREVTPEPDLRWWEARGAQELILGSLRYLLISLFALALYLLLLRPLLKRHLVQLPAAEQLAGPAPATADRSLPAHAEPEPGASELETAMEVAMQTGLKRKRKASTYEQYMKDVRELAEEDPRMVAMVVRSWMIKNG